VNLKTFQCFINNFVICISLHLHVLYVPCIIQNQFSFHSPFAHVHSKISFLKHLLRNWKRKMITILGHLIFIYYLFLCLKFGGIWLIFICLAHYIILLAMATQVYFTKILKTLKIDHPYVYCNLENLLGIPPSSKYNKK
jgi:hypothetical protein